MSQLGYIYTLTCPIRNRVVYVGATKDPVKRISSHLGRQTGNSLVALYMKWLRDQNAVPVMKIIEVCFPEKMPFRERYHIIEHGKKGMFLLNQNMTEEYVYKKKSKVA